MIEAGGNVTLERCVFVLDGPAASPGSTALAFGGGVLKADGCRFENFDRGLDASCFNGSSVTAVQCQFVDTRTAPADAAPGGGWAVRFRGMPGGSTAAKAARSLSLERCTVKGTGLVAFEGFSPAMPAKVALKGCAVLADALIGWAGAGAGPAPGPARDSLVWAGRDDLYDIRGKSWVVPLAVGAQPAPPPTPESPADLDAWTRTLAEEQTPLTPPIKLGADLAVAGQPAATTGADPARVGPTGASAKP